VPIVRSGAPIASPRWVMLSEEVFEAMIASGEA
jgi:hypothetical protein